MYCLSVVSSHSSFPGYPHIRRPPLPDYHSAAHMAQLARHKQMAAGDRTQSHDGIYPGVQVKPSFESQASEGRLRVSHRTASGSHLLPGLGVNP